ncbi:MAG TPA: hypothetical protein VE262_25930 [Blastocatellia bacterium]|nr:hypothetical protein [Blastocatellia bacterium]
MPVELYGALEQVWNEMLDIVLMILMVMSGGLLTLYFVGNCIYFISRRQSTKETAPQPLLGTEVVTPFLEHKSIITPRPAVLEDLRAASNSKSDLMIWQEALFADADPIRAGIIRLM